MRKFTIYLLCFFVAVCPGCALLSTPEGRSQVEAKLDAALADGRITKAQHDAAIEAVENGPKGINWEGILSTGLDVLMTVLIGGAAAKPVTRAVLAAHAAHKATMPTSKPAA